MRPIVEKDFVFNVFFLLRTFRQKDLIMMILTILNFSCESNFRNESIWFCFF